MKTYLLAAAGVILIGMSVAACTAGPTGTPPAATTNAASAPANDRTYSNDDIAAILKSVNTQLNLGGTIAAQDGLPTQPENALAAFLSGSSVTITPQRCDELLQSNNQILSQLGTELVTVSVLSSSKLTINLTAVAGAPIPPSKVASFPANQRALLNSCKHVTITETVNGQPTSIAIDYKPLTVHTTANQTVGFEENWAITGGGGASTSSNTTLQAIDGNLLIVVSGVTVQDAASLEKVVNAVVGAAK